ncbi:MAG: sulfotransferase family protein [Candidatus Korarchaeum sp.]|nr:sulfotransferase family protein [Candidatus Korarchaeum sp.]MDW8036092.1 sulfotransferase family 2 domain-containing protein [Candidatus Korarchaeum sp.]
MISRLRYLRPVNSSLRMVSRILGKEPAHFLHIGKTGGTAIKYSLRRTFLTEEYSILLHTHSTTLMDVPKGEKVFFFVRDPIQRFVSGFYSRQREGRPRYYAPHTLEEREAFFKFRTPNELAEALSSNDVELKSAAVKAMRSIMHVRNSYWDWFHDESYFISRIDDVIFVGRQEHLNEDFERLKDVLGLPKHLNLPQDEVRAHRTPPAYDRSLSELASSNLREWYGRCYEFLRLLQELGLVPAGSYP